MDGDQSRGASAVEYGLMLAAIAAVIVGIVFTFGGVVKTALNSCHEAAAAATTNQAPC